MKTTYLTKTKTGFLKNWATAYQQAISHSSHTPLLSKIKTYGGYILHESYASDGASTLDAYNDEAEEWDNLLYDLKSEGVIEIAEESASQIKYRFTSMAAAEQILAL